MTEPGEEIQIRAAQPDDVELLLALIQELADYEKLAHKAKGEADALRRSLFEEEVGEALIIEVDGEPVGHAIFFPTLSSFECRPGIWLEDVFVRPQYRRRGIGGAVMEYLASLAIERDYVRLEWCALDWNEPALRFYDGLGATRLDDWTMLRLEGDGLRQLARRRLKG